MSTIEDHANVMDEAVPEAVIACSLADRDLAARSAMYRETLFAGIRKRRETPAGYAFRFTRDPAWRARIDAFVTAERQCCAFLEIEVTDDASGLWLSLRGPAGTKAFIREVFDTGPGV